MGTTQDAGTKDRCASTARRPDAGRCPLTDSVALPRIQALLQWVHDSSRVASEKAGGPSGYAGASAYASSASLREFGLLMPSPSHLHCVAAVLWHSYELPVSYDLHALLSRELFE